MYPDGDIPYKVAGILPLTNTLLKIFPVNTTIGGIVCPDALEQARMVIWIFELEVCKLLYIPSFYT